MRERQAARGGSPLVKSMSHPGAFMSPVASGGTDLVSQVCFFKTRSIAGSSPARSIMRDRRRLPFGSGSSRFLTSFNISKDINLVYLRN